jgi:glutathione-regulated potassium-efflux system ancillary protein KefC
MADTFEDHDERLLNESYDLRGDRDAYVGFVRKSTEMLDRVMQADRDEAEARRKGEDKAAE